MRVTYSAYSTVQHYPRVSREDFTLGEAIRTYFTILFGVAALVMAHYYLFPHLH
jgi:hypothetical protein